MNIQRHNGRLQHFGESNIIILSYRRVPGGPWGEVRVESRQAQTTTLLNF